MVAAFREVVAYWPAVSVAGVEVKVASGVLTLTGTTSSEADALTVKGIARQVVGVVEVENALRGSWSHQGPAAPRRRRALPGRR
jgi:hypothetical protein